MEHRLGPPDVSPELIFYVIRRQEAEAGNADGVVAHLTRYIRPDYAKKTFGKLRLAFGGYDDDPRELRQIGDVRRFVRRLNKAFPYLFFLADLRSDTLLVFATCLCRITELAPEQLAFDLKDLRAFRERQSKGLGELWARLSWPEGGLLERKRQIDEYFSNQLILN